MLPEFVQGLVIVIKEKLSSGRLVKELSGWHSSYFHYVLKLLSFTFARENRYTSVELTDNASEAPHVNFHVVGQAKDYLWGSVESRLYVCVDPFLLETGRSKVNYFDARFVDSFKKDVFRF